MHITIRLLTVVFVLLVSRAAWAVVDSNTGESTEIKFQASTSAELAWPLKTKAAALDSPVEIFEYVRNNYDFALYHGARSGSINTFLGMRGNDVDLAATLIAMLRARGYAARYAVGTVRLPSAKVANWLAVENIDLAYALLRDQGIQAVTMAGDKSTISFEHVWVEVRVPYGNYRGAGSAAIDCATTPVACNWVPLDPSFKQRKYSKSLLDPYASGLQFDYPAYYQAVRNNTTSLLNKNPVEIYQNQIQAWLQANAPGKTLADIPDFGGIIVEEDELLPASLPFVTTGAVRRYNSIADHDEGEQSPGTSATAAEPKKWIKYVEVTPLFGIDDNLAAPVGSVKVDLVTASTQRLTYSLFTSGSALVQAFRLNGVVQAAGSVAVDGGIVNGQKVAADSPVVLRVSMDASPAPGPGSDERITAEYRGAIGGYYLIATGGETSNWAQVHRASQQLLKAGQTYNIVFNPADNGCVVTTGSGCTPYIASPGANSYTSSLPRLLDSPQALDDLTGGLLAVAASQYYASLRDNLSTLDSLNKIKTPVRGFLGVVSSSNRVEYIDGTAFSVQPGGLLIDMKGITVGGSWRIGASSENSNSHFELFGHAMSSLEHETWQKLTGYDAISTVRGFQLSLSKPKAFLVSVKRSNTGDNIAAMYSSFGYDTTAPAGFTRNTYPLWGNDYVAWTSPAAGAQFVGMRTTVQGLADKDPLRRVITCIDGCNTNGTLKFYKDTFDALTRSATVPFSSFIDGESDYYYWYDIVVNDWQGDSGFGVTSYYALNDNTYRFNLQETALHNGGQYDLAWTSFYGEVNRGFSATLTGNFNGWTVNSVSITDARGNALFWSVGSLSKTNGEIRFYVAPAATMPDGFYPLYAKVNVTVSGVTTTTAPVSLGTAVVRRANGNGAAYVIRGSQPYAAKLSKNQTLTCNGNTYPNQTPTAALTYLKGCFDSEVVNNSDFKFLSADAGSVQLRAVPVTGDKQLSTQVANIRNTLYRQNIADSWLEYILPDVLSTTENMRFSVDLRRERDTATGSYLSLTFEIANEWTSAASGGYVLASPIAANAEQAAAESRLDQCANIQGAPLTCQR